MKRSTLVLLALSTLPLSIGAAHALEMTEEFYAVISAGRAIKSTSPVQAEYDAMLAPQITQTTTKLESEQTADRNGYKLQMGYKLTDNFALEGGYVRLGKARYDASYSSTLKTPNFPKLETTQPQLVALLPDSVRYKTVQTSGTASREVEYSGINLSLVGSKQVTDDFSVFAKAGAIHARVKARSSGFGTAESSKSKWRPILGVGADYFFDDMFGIRAEYERYNKLGDKDTVGTMDINMMSLGLIGKF